MTVKYVLSAHGRELNEDLHVFNLNGTINYYVYSHEVFISLNSFQTEVCKGETIPIETYTRGKIYSDMYFTSDVERRWYSGLVNCETKQVLYNIDRNGPIHLSTILQIIEENQIQTYPSKSFELHILTCRYNELIPSEPEEFVVDDRTIEGIFTKDFKSMKIKSESDMDIEILKKYIKHNNQTQDNNFYLKYIKYKKKYLELKNKMTIKQ
jgi:hypothetical protein